MRQNDEDVDEKKGIGFRKYPLEVDENPKLTPVEKKIWWVIRMRDTGPKHCWASNAYIAKRAKTSISVVSHAISKLIKLGYLLPVKAPDRRGLGRVIKIDPSYRDRYAAFREDYNKLWCSKDEGEEGTEPSCKDTIPMVHLQQGDGANTPTDRDNVMKTRVLKKRKDVSSIQVSSDTDLAISQLPSKIAVVFKYWKSKRLHLPKPTTKAWGRSFELINGLFTGAAFSQIPALSEHKKQYGIAQIKLSIDRFAQSVHDAAMLPVKKSTVKGTTPDMFILNEFRSVKGNSPGHSYFIHYLYNEPQQLKQPSKLDQDDHPELTKMLIAEYNNEIMGGLNPRITNENMNRFIAASKRLHEFCKQFRSKFVDVRDTSPSGMARLLIKCVIDGQHGVTQNISPGYLCSNETFTRRFPAYLFQKSYIMEDVEGQPWKYAVHQFSSPFNYDDPQY